MSSQRGFTLIEIMIVLAIVAGLITVVAPKLVNKEANVRSVARQILVLSKEVRNRARLSNSTYRIAFSLDAQDPKYWIEKAKGPQTIDTHTEENKKDRDEKNPEPEAFQKDKSLSKKDHVLPGKLHFGSVETINMKSPITSGMAYVHFFSEGFVEAAAVQITDGNKLTWTLVFNPLTGQADIIEKAQSLKDLQR